MSVGYIRRTRLTGLTRSYEQKLIVNFTKPVFSFEGGNNKQAILDKFLRQQLVEGVAIQAVRLEKKHLSAIHV